MAGSIIITENNHWSMGSSIYHWVAEFLIANINDKEIAQKIQFIEDNNLQCIDFADFTPEQQRKLTETLTTKLIPYAKRRIPLDYVSRRSRLDLLWELSARAKFGAKWGEGNSPDI